MTCPGAALLHLHWQLAVALALLEGGGGWVMMGVGVGVPAGGSLANCPWWLLLVIGGQAWLVAGTWA
jgi:hypothetical protein